MPTFDMTPQEVNDWIRCCVDANGNRTTLVPPQRGMLAYRAVKQVNRWAVPGHIVEAGVWRGGMSCLMARAQLRSDVQTNQLRGRRHVWLFDTFEGMPAPRAEDDGRAKGRWASMKQWNAANESALFNNGAEYVEAKTGIRRWNYGPMSLVKANVLSTGFNPKLIHLTKGKVEDTLYARGRQRRASRSSGSILIGTTRRGRSSTYYSRGWCPVGPSLSTTTARGRARGRRWTSSWRRIAINLSRRRL